MSHHPLQAPLYLAKCAIISHLSAEQLETVQPLIQAAEDAFTAYDNAARFYKEKEDEFGESWSRARKDLGADLSKEEIGYLEHSTGYAQSVLDWKASEQAWKDAQKVACDALNQLRHEHGQKCQEARRQEHEQVLQCARESVAHLRQVVVS